MKIQCLTITYLTFDSSDSTVKFAHPAWQGREVLYVVVAADGTEGNSSAITPAHTRRIQDDLCAKNG